MSRLINLLKSLDASVTVNGYAIVKSPRETLSLTVIIAAILPKAVSLTNAC